MKPEFKRVSKGVYRYEGTTTTTYLARVRRNGRIYTKSFEKFAEAREFHQNHSEKATAKIGRPKLGVRTYVSFHRNVTKHGAYRVTTWNGPKCLASKQFSVPERTLEARAKVEATARKFMKEQMKEAA